MTDDHHEQIPRGQLTTWDILDLAPFRVYVVDVAARQVVYSNARGARGADVGLQCYEEIYQESRPCLNCPVPQLIDADGQPNGQVLTYERFDEADDRWYQLHEGTMALSDGRTAMYSIALDIGAVKEAQNNLAAAHAELAFKNQQLETLSITDRLTDIFNRRKLDEVLERECLRAQRTGSALSLIIIDVDHFKRVNDTYGHQRGDEVLRDIARILRQNVRALDTVGRWGGEEFMIICTETPRAGAAALAESIRTEIENHAFPDMERITASLGVAECRADGRAEELVRHADQALYRAKEEGRNQVLVYGERTWD
ncbi:MAG: GGDEF domain-containing protein [Rhodocyclales bacterium]|nr:GGDEF domain-containing protein [Rhodocyclales bacterium]